MSSLVSACIGNAIALRCLVMIFEELPITLDIVLTEEYYFLYGEQVKAFMESNFN